MGGRLCDSHGAQLTNLVCGKPCSDQPDTRSDMLMGLDGMKGSVMIFQFQGPWRHEGRPVKQMRTVNGNVLHSYPLKHPKLHLLSSPPPRAEGVSRPLQLCI